MITTAGYWLLVVVGVPVFWLVPGKFRYGFLAAASGLYLVSLGGSAVVSIGLLLFWSTICYATAPRLAAGEKRYLLPAIVIGVLACLVYFKYMPSLVQAVFGESVMATVALPLGISFFTFKLIHYVIEVKRGNITNRSAQQFFCYMLLFPIFSAGPIERFDHFLKHQEGRFSKAAFVEGVTRIYQGLIKKLVIADMALPQLYSVLTHRELSAQTFVGNLDSYSPHGAWLFLAMNFLIAYLDFSSYSDIAIGTSRLFGIHIMENFDWPILATSVGDFWKRWHMTLAGWCQAYLYMTVIGLTRRPYLAIFMTFVAMGLWHAGSFNWIAWGVWHATGVAVYVTFLRFKRNKTFVGAKVAALVTIPATFMFVTAGSAFTFAHPEISIGEGFRVWLRLFSIHVYF